jgi:hypothetical protein
MPKGAADSELDKMLKTLNFKELPQITRAQVEKIYQELYRVENFELFLRLKIANTYERGFTHVTDQQSLDYFRGYARAYTDMLSNVRGINDKKINK